MNPPDISARIKAYLETEFPNPGIKLTNETNLLDDWFVDSLSLIELVMFLEKEFSINLQRVDINGSNFYNIDSLAQFVSSKLDANK